MSGVGLFPWFLPENRGRKRLALACDPFPGGYFHGPAVDASSLFGIPDVWEIRTKRRASWRWDPDIYKIYLGTRALAHLWGMPQSKASALLQTEYAEAEKRLREVKEDLEATNDYWFGFFKAHSGRYDFFMWLDATEDTGVYKIRFAKRGGDFPILVDKFVLSLRGVRRVEQRNGIRNRLWDSDFKAFIRPRLREWWSYKEAGTRQRSYPEFWAEVGGLTEPIPPPARLSVDYRKKKRETSE